jgi:hypothetical protein
MYLKKKGKIYRFVFYLSIVFNFRSYDLWSVVISFFQHLLFLLFILKGCKVGIVSSYLHDLVCPNIFILDVQYCIYIFLFRRGVHLAFTRTTT